MNWLSLFAVVLSTLGSLHSAMAMGSSTSGSAISLGFSSISPSQNDMNTHITTVNSSNSTSIDKFGTGYEVFGQYTYRFSGTMFGLYFRPGYFWQSAKGSGYDYQLTGFSFYPGMRFYPLENTYMKFYLQVGVGYGMLSGKAKQPSGEVDFAGGAFGALGGVGAEFCITPSHCLFVEGNLRYNPIERNLVTKASGTPTGFSQSTTDQEIEFNNTDVKTSMSGVQGVFGYTMWF